MERPEQARERSLSHKDYLETLHRPSVDEWRRISDIQRRKESEIDSKYHTAEEHEAAVKIQKAYRGHRERRQLEGLTLDPSTRWIEIIKEWKYRSATAPLFRRTSSQTSSDGHPRTPSEIAKQNWQRVGHIVEHAVDGGPSSPSRVPSDYLSAKRLSDPPRSEEAADTMLMDMRYFLEMVDQKHRYGANLLVYHEEWVRSKVSQNFFYWLDHGEGRHLDLPGCSRAKLNKERIRYLSKDERMNYLAVVDDQGKLRWHKNDELITTSVEQFKDSMDGVVSKDNEEAVAFDDEEVSQKLSDSRRFARQIARARSSDSRRSSDVSVGSLSDTSDYQSPVPDNGKATKKKKRNALKRLQVSPATILNQLLRASVKPGTWIYVSDIVGRLYVGIKSSGTFQHASFLSGARISSAGSIGIENGQLTYLSPLSGHYRPTTRSFRKFIRSLTNEGVDLSQLRVSHAYEVLLSMEYYGKSKKGAQKVLHRKKDSKDDKRPKSSDSKEYVGVNDVLTTRSIDNVSATSFGDSMSATSMVEQNWRRDHRKGLAKLMDDLHIHRRSFDGT